MFIFTGSLLFIVQMLGCSRTFLDFLNVLLLYKDRKRKNPLKSGSVIRGEVSPRKAVFIVFSSNHRCGFTRTFLIQLFQLSPPVSHRVFLLYGVDTFIIKVLSNLFQTIIFIFPY